MTVFLIRRMSRFLLAGYLVLLTLGTAGCGGEGKGDLYGKVSYQGKPLAVGSVLFLGADAKPRTARIEEDGSYHFTDVPIGEAKLAVYSLDPAEEAALRKMGRKKRARKDKPAAADMSVADHEKWFAIPVEYSDMDHSGLRVTIHPGPNNYDIDMK